MTISITILLLQAFSTWFLFGMIFFVQVVHYPLLSRVGEDQFVEYEQQHVFRTTNLVAIPMITELVCALAWFFFLPAEIPAALAVVGAGLLVVVWVSSYAFQVPQHHRLRSGFVETHWRFLVNSNWIRTAAWGARALLLAYCLLILVLDAGEIIVEI